MTKINRKEVEVDETANVDNEELEARMAEEKRVAEEIEKVLLGNEFALQPFMAYSEFGISPRVRLVKVPNNETNEQGTDKAEPEQNTESDGATKSKQS